MTISTLVSFHSKANRWLVIMDSKLNEFLNEINEIAPLKSKPKECEWKECFDSTSGFSYYWNTKTDEVTWEKPRDVEPASYAKLDPKEILPTSPSMSELMKKVKEPGRIYKLALDNNLKESSHIPKTSSSTETKPHKHNSGKKKKSSDSEDEKITLITSYGSDEESEENDKTKPKTQSERAFLKHTSDDGDFDILSTAKKRAEEMKKDKQMDIKHIPKKIEEIITVPKPSKQKPSLSGFSLIAGYDSNSEGDEIQDDNSEAQIFQTPVDEVDKKKHAHSTLFPISNAPDVNDLIEKVEPVTERQNKILPESPFDAKTFQRKRRLGVSFIPTQRIKACQTLPDIEGERKGFGFNSTEITSVSGQTKPENGFYTNFSKGGVEFMKSESNDTDAKEKGGADDISLKDIEPIYDILHEKLGFLCEGNENVMPVQIILIQIETLFGALKAGCLKPSYLHDWLEGTSEDLLRLEKDAAPLGWLLQWDRSQKRYYYHNQSTGEGRWDYPRSDSVNDDEAMDICTTPPRPDDEENFSIAEEQPPLPTSPLRSPSPPPPPVISRPDPSIILDAPNAPTIANFEDQPPPPGVDNAEPAELKQKALPEDNSIKTAFDTFYSELAAIESTSNTSSPSNIVIEQLSSTESMQDSNPAEPPKKKKKKVKLGQGLSLKKKDVSKLVEKWKNVQKNY